MVYSSRSSYNNAKKCHQTVSTRAGLQSTTLWALVTSLPCTGAPERSGLPSTQTHYLSAAGDIKNASSRDAISPLAAMSYFGSAIPSASTRVDRRLPDNDVNFLELEFAHRYDLELSVKLSAGSLAELYYFWPRHVLPE